MTGGQVPTFAEILDTEAEAVAAGSATACGALLLDAACGRISTHLDDGQAARESHAARAGDPPTWTTWLDT